MSNIKKIMNLERKQTEYDEQYYQDHKEKLLNERKQTYHTDNEHQTKIKEKQQLRSLDLNTSRSPLLKSDGSSCVNHCE